MHHALKLPFSLFSSFFSSRSSLPLYLCLLIELIPYNAVSFYSCNFLITILSQISYFVLIVSLCNIHFFILTCVLCTFFLYASYPSLGIYSNLHVLPSRHLLLAYQISSCALTTVASIYRDCPFLES